MFSHYFGLQQKTGPGGGILVDPYFANVALLMHCEGAEGAGVFIDSSSFARSLTTHGTAQTIAAAVKFGTRGMSLNNMPGPMTDYVTTAASAGLQISGDFTFECFVTVTDGSSGRYFFGIGGANATFFCGFGTQVAGKFSANFRNDLGTTFTVSSDALSFVGGTCYYFAVTLSGTTLSLTIDGVLQAATTIHGARYTQNAAATIGAVGTFGYGHHGYLDEVRLTLGIARNVSSTPSAAFPDSGSSIGATPKCLPRGTLTTPFAVDALPSLFAITGAAIGTVTLATVTSTDAAMTALIIDQSGSEVTIPGLTFSYAANVLTVSGTPTGHSKIYSIGVCYRSSDGTGRAVGASLHDITIANAADVLTIGSMVNPSIRQGQYSSTTILSPTTNFAVGLLAVPRIAVPGMDIVLSWTIGSSSGSGSVLLSGTPTVAGSYTLKIDYYTSDGTVLLGTSTHTVAVSAAYVSPPAPPAPSPGPAPPAPSPPPAPTPTPQPGHGPDPYFSSVKALLHFDDASNIAKDQISSNTWTNAQTLYVSGAVGGAGGFASSSKLSCAIAGVEGLSGLLTVELMFDIDSVAWDALTADGADFRWCPISYLVAQDGSVLWALGLFSYYSSYYKFRYTRAGFYMPLLSLPGDHTFVQPFGPIIPSRPNKFMHLAGAIKPRPGGSGFDHVGCVWLNGDPGVGSSTFLASRRVTKTGLVVVIGGSGGSIPAYYGGQSNIVNFSGKIDEYRLTAEARYASYMDVTAYAIPEVARTIPWSNS